MALLFIDGFDHYATADLGAKYTATSGGTIGGGYARTGAGGLYSTSSSARQSITLAPATTASGVCGFAFQPKAVCDGFFSVENGDGPQFILGMAGDYTLYAKRNSAGGTTFGTSAVPVPLDTWSYLEVKWTIHNSTGSVLVYLNGDHVTPILSATAQDTQYQTDATWTMVKIGTQVSGDSAWYDDLYIADQQAAAEGPPNDDVLGDVRVITVLPSTGNGSNTDFTLSTGTDHGAVVDEAAPNGDTDYAYSSTQNHVDTYNFPALGATGVVYGVQLNLNAKKTDSGTREIAGVARPVATNRIGATRALTTSYVYHRQVWDYSPETDSDWTVAEIDGSEFGVKVIT